MNTNVSKLPVQASLSSVPTENQLKDVQFRSELLRLAANEAFIYQGYKAQADSAGASMSKGLWLVTRGYFLSANVPPAAMVDIKEWKHFVSEDGGNHAAKLEREFKVIAKELQRSQPSKFDEKFFDQKSSYWAKQISRIRTALLDGVNPIAKDSNGEFTTATIDAAQALRTKIKEHAKEMADRMAEQEGKILALSSPEGKRLAMAEKVGEAVKQLLLCARDTDQMNVLIHNTNLVSKLANTIQSQGAGVLSEAARDKAVAEFERELAAIVAYDPSSDVNAEAKRQTTTATISAMTREPVANDDDVDTGGMTPQEAYEYGELAFKEGVRILQADRPDMGTMEWVSYHKGYIGSAMSWINSPAGDTAKDRDLDGEDDHYSNVIEDVKHCKAAIK